MDISINNSKYAKQADLLELQKKIDELTFEYLEQGKRLQSLIYYVNDLRDLAEESLADYAKLMGKIVPAKYRPQYTNEVEKIDTYFHERNKALVLESRQELDAEIEKLEKIFGLYE